MILLAALVGLTATVGLMMLIIGTTIVEGQTSNRAEMERIREEFERIVGRLGEEEGDSS